MAFLLTDDDLASLLREKFAGPSGAQRLSQVLVAIFGTERPDGVTVDGPVTIRQPSADVPALNLEPYPGATVPALSGGGGGGGGGVTPADVDFGTPADPAGQPQSFPFVMYGIIQGGSGNNYTVRCWMTDPSSGAPLGDFPCLQDQIDPSETIPSGTHCLVWCSLGTGFHVGAMRLTVPVYL